MRVYRMVDKDGHGPFSSINSPIDYVSHHKTPYTMIFGKCDTFRKSVLAKLGKPEWVFAWDTERRMFEFFTNAERIEEMGFVILCLDVADDSLVFEDGQVLFNKSNVNEVERWTPTEFVKMFKA